MIRVAIDVGDCLLTIVMSDYVDEHDIDTVRSGLDRMSPSCKSINVLCRLEGFLGYTMKGLWARTFLSVKNESRVRRMAVLGEEELSNIYAQFASVNSEFPVEVFAPENTSEALGWLAQPV